MEIVGFRRGGLFFLKLSQPRGVAALERLENRGEFIRVFFFRAAAILSLNGKLPFVLYQNPFR